MSSSRSLLGLASPTSPSCCMSNTRSSALVRQSIVARRACMFATTCLAHACVASHVHVSSRMLAGRVGEAEGRYFHQALLGPAVLLSGTDLARTCRLVVLPCASMFFSSMYDLHTTDGRRRRWARAYEYMHSSLRDVRNATDVVVREPCIFIEAGTAMIIAVYGSMQDSTAACMAAPATIVADEMARLPVQCRHHAGPAEYVNMCMCMCMYIFTRKLRACVHMKAASPDIPCVRFGTDQRSTAMAVRTHLMHGFSSRRVM